MTTTFSIVINTLNRANYLHDALKGISELNHDNYEVIVINGPSTDNTNEILKRYPFPIKIGTCPEPNLSKSRNIGIEMAAGEIVCFIDDDAIPHPHWLNKLEPHYSDAKVGAVGGFTIDNTGTQYQVMKTVCDRYGNAYFPSEFFDEGAVNFPGSPVYPSLLGTNSSFRRSALDEVGGFDHAYAYLLDETDVCLRLNDSGYRVVYEPDALIYHQFAQSHIRSSDKIPKTLYPSAVSKSYFISTHGLRYNGNRSQEELNRYKSEILNSNRWLYENGRIDRLHRLSLDDDLLFGIQEGQRLASLKAAKHNIHRGDLNTEIEKSPFKKFKGKPGLSIALISQSFPPENEAGIARWTWMMAIGLAARGHKIHVISNTDGAPVSQYKDGFWLHRINTSLGELANDLERQFDIPQGVAAWCAAVKRKLESLSSYRIDVVSYPIWDLEGLGLIDESKPAVVMSLHTSYALAKPFKQEWNSRPLYEHFHVNRMIKAEKFALGKAKMLLANSEAIIDDIEASYNISIRHKSTVVAHGTNDPKTTSNVFGAKNAHKDGPLRVSFVGRFEPRKGFDIACSAFVRSIRKTNMLTFDFIGDELEEQKIPATFREELLRSGLISFKGTLSRDALQQAYLRSDIVVMPSRYESFGLVAIEAMASGCAVIALRVGGLKEVISDGQDGFLVDDNESADVNISNILLELQGDQSRLVCIQEGARRTFESKFSIEAMVKQAEEVYYRASGVHHA